MSRPVMRLCASLSAYALILASRLITHTIVIVNFPVWLFTVAAAGVAMWVCGYAHRQIVEQRKGVPLWRNAENENQTGRSGPPSSSGH